MKLHHHRIENLEQIKPGLQLTPGQGRTHIHYFTKPRSYIATPVVGRIIERHDMMTKDRSNSGNVSQISRGKRVYTRGNDNYATFDGVRISRSQSKDNGRLGIGILNFDFLGLLLIF